MRALRIMLLVGVLALCPLLLRGDSAGLAERNPEVWRGLENSLGYTESLPVKYDMFELAEYIDQHRQVIDELLKVGSLPPIDYAYEPGAKLVVDELTMKAPYLTRLLMRYFEHNNNLRRSSAMADTLVAALKFNALTANAPHILGQIVRCSQIYIIYNAVVERHDFLDDLSIAELDDLIAALKSAEESLHAGFKRGLEIEAQVADEFIIDSLRDSIQTEPDDYSATVAEYRELLRAMAVLLDEPLNREWSELIKRADNFNKNYTHPPASLYGLLNIYRQALARSRMLHAVLGAVRYNKEHGEFPLYAEQFLPANVADSDGISIRYKLLDRDTGKFVVVSSEDEKAFVYTPRKIVR